ncbi:MAG: glycosyltransferase [Muribaculaceae bacterium]|nr:glycosyltransferase [Muribaculaceae bacterium]
MADNIKVSVCIPVYGVEKYIGRCAESLFRQTLKDGIEFIFIDDCSPDNSIGILEECLEKYSDRKNQVRIIRHSRNLGLGAARQTALEHVRGEYVICCDSDDWVDENLYESLLYEAEKNDADMVICGYCIDNPEESVPVVIPRIFDNRKLVNAMLGAEVHCGSWNKLVRKSLFDRNSISYPSGINMWEDVNVMIRIAYFTKKISYTDKSSYHYWVANSGSYTYSPNQNSLRNQTYVIGSLEEFFRFHKDYGMLESLNYLKLTAKLNGLLYADNSLAKEYSGIYPESSKNILRYKRLSLYWRVALIINRIFGYRIFSVMAKLANRVR